MLDGGLTILNELAGMRATLVFEKKGKPEVAHALAVGDRLACFVFIFEELVELGIKVKLLSFETDSLKCFLDARCLLICLSTG